MELTYAKDARVGFLEDDSEHLAMDPLSQPGQKAMFITSQDGEGVTLIGTMAELRDFADRLYPLLFPELEDLMVQPLAARLRAALTLLENEHITPMGRRILEKILDEEENR